MAPRPAHGVLAALALRAGGVLDMWLDQTEEFLDRCVPIERGFPDELHGSSLYYAGPSLWSLPNGQRARHAFDGLGRLHRFYHSSNSSGELLCHSARFIRGPGANAILSGCDLTAAGNFRVVEGAAWWARLPLASLLASNLDNTWVNQLPFTPGRLELMTDTSEVLEADAQTLEVTEKISWRDSVVASWLPIPPLSTAHACTHPESGHAYNILLDPGVMSNDVVLVRRDRGSPDMRVEVARIGVGARQLIQHSFALSLDFALVVGHPMFLDPAKAVLLGDLLGGLVEQPTVQNFTRIFVVPLNSSDSPAGVRHVDVAPFILVHVVNAYRSEGGALVLDFEGRPATPQDTETFYGAFRMELVREPDSEGSRRYFQDHFEGRGYGLYRVEIPAGERGDGSPDAPAILQKAKPLHTSTLVFPQISPLARGRRHCFVWAPEGRAAVTGYGVAVVKLDLCGGPEPRVAGVWELQSYSLVAEASLVPSRVDGAKEDDGWLLAPVQEVSPGGRAALAVVDAASMALVSLVKLRPGDALNWGAHSTYLSAAEVAAGGGTREAREEQTLTGVRDALLRCSRLATGAAAAAEL